MFIDEIHRFNKAQQDAFLPYVEAGDIILIGATTENPSFEVNSALLSRSKVFVLTPLEQEAMTASCARAWRTRECGLGACPGDRAGRAGGDRGLCERRRAGALCTLELIAGVAMRRKRRRRRSRSSRRSCSAAR